MARARRDSRHQVDIWPGFVDALSTLVLSIIFLLVVFVLAQFFLGQVLVQRCRQPVYHADEIVPGARGDTRAPAL